MKIADLRPHASQPQAPGPIPPTAGADLGNPLPAENQAEYDRRGLLLPARALVGGIITPQ